MGAIGIFFREPNGYFCLDLAIFLANLKHISNPNQR